jgi:hypothetical protein
MTFGHSGTLIVIGWRQLRMSLEVCIQQIPFDLFRVGNECAFKYEFGARKQGFDL